VTDGPTPGGRRRAFGTLVLVGVTVVTGALLRWVCLTVGPGSLVFALMVVWLPMIGLGIVSRFVRPRLPARFHELRGVERDGRIHELLGVRIAKRLLRRGPLAAFNPDLHLPAVPDADGLARLDRRMRDAEATHAVLFVVSTVVALHAVARGWLGGAMVTMLANVLMNGYPVMLQRYNRALLAQRFPLVSRA